MAIIAAVLLFGSAATLGILQWVAIAVGVILFIWLVAALFVWIVKGAASAIKESREQGLSMMIWCCFGLAAMAWGLVVVIDAAVLWLGRTGKPFDAAIGGWAGIGLLIILAVGVPTTATVWLYERRAKIPAAFRFMLSILIRLPVAPYSLPRLAWMRARAEGAGMFVSIADAALGFIFGLVAWALMLGGILFLIEK